MARAYLRFTKFGIPEPSLSPFFGKWRKLDDSTNMSPIPQIEEIGEGLYYFDYNDALSVFFEAQSGDYSIPVGERSIYGTLCGCLSVGDYPITIRARDPDENPIERVSFLVSKVDTGDYVLSGEISTGGQVVLSLNAGQYYVYLFRRDPDYDFMNPTRIEVTNDEEQIFTITGYPSFNRILPNPSVARLYGRVILPSGQSAVKADVLATVINFPSLTPVTNNTIKVQTRKDGTFSMTIVCGLDIRFEIPVIGLAREFTVPCKSSVSLEEIAGSLSVIPVGARRALQFLETDRLHVSEIIFDDNTTQTTSISPPDSGHIHLRVPFTLSQDDISNKRVKLPIHPNLAHESISELRITGVEQEPESWDFIQIGDDWYVTWSGTDLEDFFEVGNKIVMLYFM